MTVDAGEHLGILHHVVNSATMGIPDHMKEEALSEGMVILVKAAQEYDPTRRVPVHYWLAKKLRWNLANWRDRERRKHSAISIEYDSPYLEMGDILSHDPAGENQARLELEHLVEVAKEILSDKEYIAIFGQAFGMHMKEIAHVLGVNPNQIKALQMQGRERILVNEMRLI